MQCVYCDIMNNVMHKSKKNPIGDSWNNMRSTLERVFSHESAMKSVEETKQYEKV